MIADRKAGERLTDTINNAGVSLWTLYPHAGCGPTSGELQGQCGRQQRVYPGERVSGDREC